MRYVLSKINSLEKLIGNTPLVEISFKYREKKLIEENYEKETYY